MRRNTFQAYPYALWLAIFTIIPMIIVVWFAFTNADGDFTLENFSGMAAYAVVFWRSFRLAIISTAACLVLGYGIRHVAADKKRSDDSDDAHHASYVDELPAAHVRMAYHT